MVDWIIILIKEKGVSKEFWDSLSFNDLINNIVVNHMTLKDV